jgi:hypothetical protein
MNFGPLAKVGVVDIPRNLSVGGPLRYNCESKRSTSLAGAVVALFSKCSVLPIPLSARAYVEGRRVHNVEPKRLTMETPTKVRQPMNTNRRRRFTKRTSLSNETMFLCPWVVLVEPWLNLPARTVKYSYEQKTVNANELSSWACPLGIERTTNGS